MDVVWVLRDTGYESGDRGSAGQGVQMSGTHSLQQDDPRDFPESGPFFQWEWEGERHVSS